MLGIFKKICKNPFNRCPIFFDTEVILPILNDFEYFKPTYVDEAINRLSTHKNAAILAGGTDLIVNLKQEITTPDAVVDIKGIDELKKIKYMLHTQGFTIEGAKKKLKVDIANKEQISLDFPVDKKEAKRHIINELKKVKELLKR